jgi:fructokinase
VENIADVIIDGAFADGESVGDFLVGQPRCNQIQNLQFSLRECIAGMGVAAGCHGGCSGIFTHLPPFYGASSKWRGGNPLRTTIICFGELLFDRLVGDGSVQADPDQRFPGGAPANVATALVKLGTPAGLIARVGQDAAGQELAALMVQLGVDACGLQQDRSRPTRQVEVLRDARGDRRFGGFGGRSSSDFADTALAAAAIPDALFESAQALVFGTIALAFPDSRAALKRCLDLADQQGLLRVLDLNWRPMFWPDPSLAAARIAALLPQVDVLKLTAEEAEIFLGTTEPGAIACARGAIARPYPQLRLVLVTDGERGCQWWSQGHQGFTPAFPVKAVDMTGAGDSFLAAVLHQLAQRGRDCLDDVQQMAFILRYASAVGALTTLKPGAIDGQPTPTEIEAFLKLA